MKNFYKKNRQKKAFTLIELSIVIVIVSILITGALSVSVNAVNNAKTKITKERIAEIYKALGNYVLVNKKLPCPAPITDTKSGTATYGTASNTLLCTTTGVVQSFTSANLVRGMVPVKTLGLPLDMAEDGFGDKFEYVVDKNYTVASNATTPSNGAGDFGTSSTANIIVYDKPGSAPIALTSFSGTAVANNNTAAVLVILSLGSNKSGAYGVDSTVRNARSVDSDELVNTPSTTSESSYVNGFYSSSGNSDSFDDVVFFKSRNALISDFNALFLIPCLATTSNETYGTMSWPVAWYDQEKTAVSPKCSTLGYSVGPSYPVRRCGAFGVWDVVTGPCLN